MTPHACPVCFGHGTVSKPPHVAGDQPSWTDNQSDPYACRACNGTGIVWESYIMVQPVYAILSELGSKPNGHIEIGMLPKGQNESERSPGMTPDSCPVLRGGPFHGRTAWFPASLMGADRTVRLSVPAPAGPVSGDLPDLNSRPLVARYRYNHAQTSLVFVDYD